MPDVLSLIRPDPNADIVKMLRETADQAERGEITRCVIIKLRGDHSFAVKEVGVGSGLEMAGALAFALHDIITGNVPK